MNKIRILLALLLSGNAALHAQNAADEYIRSLNSMVPGSPEAAQIRKYVDFPVDLFTGTPQISLPIGAVSGKGISVPVSLSYHAGGGINIDEQAANTGLGWALAAGGEITREIRSVADDNSGSGYFVKPQPLSYYINKLDNGVTVGDIPMWANAMHGLLDLEPDIYYFSFGGYNGKFIWDESTSSFISTTEKNHLKISLDLANSIWTIITDDGNKYIFANKESSSTQMIPMWQAPNGQFGPSSTTSWKLSRIINADATDSIMLNYTFNTYRYYTAGSSMMYKEVSGIGAPSRPPYQNSFVWNDISGATKLTSIVSKTDSISFIDADTFRLDLYQQKALGKIVICSRDNVVKNIFRLKYGYYDRSSSVIGSLPPDAIAWCQKSLRLDSLIEYGASESNAYPMKHAFAYNSQALPCRMSFAKDFWGHPNNNTYPSTLAPPMVYAPLGGTPTLLDGADRFTDSIKVKAGILEKITLPTGGTVNYAYEANTLGYPIKMATTGNVIDVLNQIFVLKAANAYFNATYDTTFTIHQEPNAFINNMQGGVFADISIFPSQTGGTNEYSSIITTKPNFLLESIQLENPSEPPVFRRLQYGNMSNVHLPNGTYHMRANTPGMNDSLQLIRALVFGVSYTILDTSATGTATNYVACGLRVKSITTKDNYSNITSTRRFLYHNQVNDSSYGWFIGSNNSSFYETLQDGNNDNRYLVRIGNNNMPGLGNVASSIVYPKVTEEISDGGIRHRTEHYYSIGLGMYPFYGNMWPFVPGLDVECARGNEEMTVWKEMQGSSFVNAKVKKQVFDFDPASRTDPNQQLSKKIYGIKSTSDSYLNASFSNGNFPAQDIQKYYTNINRLYLTSDSTITYDLNTPGSTPVTEWHDYVYGDYNLQPLVVRSGGSDGSILTQNNWYASDAPGFSAEIDGTLTAQMVAANRISQPLGTRSFRNGSLISQQFTYSHFNGSQLLVDSLRQAAFSNPLDKEIEVRSYDDNANPTAIRLRGEKYRRYLWNTDKNLATASCVMSQNSLFVFTSFEEENEPGINSNGRMAGNAFSGTYAYDPDQGGDLSFGNFSSDAGLEVYVWATGAPGAHVKLNGEEMISTGRTKGSWTLYKGTAGGNGSVSIGGNMLIDQLAILPVGSDFDGNVYDNAQRIIAKVNGNMQTAFFEYDSFGRLKLVRDEQGNIVKQNDYQYQGPQ